MEYTINIVAAKTIKMLSFLKLVFRENVVSYWKADKHRKNVIRTVRYNIG